MKINKVTQNAKAFPEVLRNIPDAPKELYILGNLQPLLGGTALAVVGSRRVTPYGKNVTLGLITKVAQKGVVIVSGLALGVDALAHQAALNAGGKTIAVLPCGLDALYPSSHRQLGLQILQQGGALISEYPPGTPPLRHHFIARNRLVSGLADGVLITEAAAKSGTLHTANFALDQGKTVMAVPGNITSDLSKGTNNLIKVGALPITSEQDILEALGLHHQQQFKEILGANREESLILELLQRGITEAEELQLLSEIDATHFNQTITMLEITGKIRSLGAGHWAIT